MPSSADSPLDLLWKEYSRAFEDFDDLILARWMSQTLGQFEGKVWRMTHPLVGAYRLAAQLGHEQGIWLKRLATPPAAYPESACCRALATCVSAATACCAAVSARGSVSAISIRAVSAACSRGRTTPK